MKTQLDSIEEAIEAIANGEVIIVVDDEDRENEGDFLTATRNVTPEVINFMATHGRGLICAPLIESRCDELGLEMMVQQNSAQFETPFTVSIDLIGHGTTTGISASDRSKTCLALIHPDTKPEELGKPGHIFPLRAKAGGVLRRAGHTEAAIDFARLAGFEPAGVIVEIMNEDGSMARLPELLKIAEQHNLKICSIEDLIAYRLEKETLIEREKDVEITTAYGDFKLVAYKQLTNEVEHLALVKGTWDENEAIPVRVHSSSMIGDVFQTSNFGKGQQLRRAMEMIEEEGKGVIVYINKLREGGGLIDELKAYEKSSSASENGSVVHKMDNKDYGIGAQILRDLGVHKMKLLTNTTSRRTGIIGYGLEIVETLEVK
ncbi:MAG: 3,4-dihydroxy-2-butanone-4-phosphate synthase [Flavobacteriales bacterium]|nr:3,4-dihydroxy-2-butanone-4-phosphate synthase [Flavobacteriales bacterium]MDG1766083.1 3,4-dihydroxy-2-butanone-4-phosphate synthase [Flavobacteriales bacterium]